MSDIKPPRRPVEDPDRFVDCQEAVEPALQAVEQAAIDAGWTPREVAAAILELAQAGVLAVRENERTDDAVIAAKRRH